MSVDELLALLQRSANRPRITAWVFPSSGFRPGLRPGYRGSSWCRHRTCPPLCLPRPYPSPQFPACTPSRLWHRVSSRFHPSSLLKLSPPAHEQAQKQKVEPQLPTAVSWCHLRRCVAESPRSIAPVPRLQPPTAWQPHPKRYDMGKLPCTDGRGLDGRDGRIEMKRRATSSRGWTSG